MKKIIAILALGFIPMTASAISDDACLRYGEMGGKLAEGLEILSEREIQDFIKGLHKAQLMKAKSELGREAANEVLSAQLKMLSYIATLKLKPDDARGMVYLKCKAGEYE